VVARHDGDVVRGAESFEEGVGLRKFRESERLTRSPVTAMWSTDCDLRSATIWSSTGARWKLPAPFLPVNEAANALAHELERAGSRSGARCGSDRCASAWRLH